MIKALRVVNDGGVYLDASLDQSFHAMIDGTHHLGRKKGNGANILTAREANILTAREADILKLIAKGLRNYEIAAALHMSERTVQFHITNMFAKLGVRSRMEALLRGKALGLIPEKSIP